MINVEKIGINPDGIHNSSFGEYPNAWKEISRKISIRDDYTCQICGEKNPKRGCVHHIDYNKSNCKFDNLIYLCPKCHGRTNGNPSNRSMWAVYLKGVVNSNYPNNQKVLNNNMEIKVDLIDNIEENVIEILNWAGINDCKIDRYGENSETEFKKINEKINNIQKSLNDLNEYWPDLFYLKNSLNDLNKVYLKDSLNDLKKSWSDIFEIKEILEDTERSYTTIGKATNLFSEKLKDFQTIDFTNFEESGYPLIKFGYGGNIDEIQFFSKETLLFKEKRKLEQDKYNTLVGWKDTLMVIGFLGMGVGCLSAVVIWILLILGVI